MKSGDRALDDPPVHSATGAVRDTASGDHRFDASGPDQAPVLVMLVAPVGQQHVWPSPWPADQTRDGRELRQGLLRKWSLFVDDHVAWDVGI